MDLDQVTPTRTPASPGCLSMLKCSGAAQRAAGILSSRMLIQCNIPPFSSKHPDPLENVESQPRFYSCRLAPCAATGEMVVDIPAWLLLLAGAAVTYSCIRRWTTLDLFKIPSPWGLPWTGQLIQLALYAYNPHQQFLKWHEALGSIVRLRIFHRDVVLVADPQVAAQLLAKGPNECYRRAPEYATYDAVSVSAAFGRSCQVPTPPPGHAWRVGRHCA